MYENLWQRWLVSHVSLYCWKTRPWLPSRPLVKLGGKDKNTSLFPGISLVFIYSACVQGCPGSIFNGRSRVPLAQKSWYFRYGSGKWGTLVWIPSGWRSYWSSISWNSDNGREGSFVLLFWLFFLLVRQLSAPAWGKSMFTAGKASWRTWEMLFLSHWEGMGISSPSMVGYRRYFSLGPVLLHILNKEGFAFSLASRFLPSRLQLKY